MSTESSGQAENLRTSSFMNVLSKLIHDPMGAFGLLIVISFLIVARVLPKDWKEAERRNLEMSANS